MAVTNPCDQYRRNAVLNAKPDKLLLMLLDGAVKFVKQADQALAEGDLPGAHLALVRAQDIVVYMRDTLNPDYEITKNLDALYGFVLERLVQANLKKDRETLVEAGRLIEELRDTWTQALRPEPPAAAEEQADNDG